MRCKIVHVEAAVLAQIPASNGCQMAKLQVNFANQPLAAVIQQPLHDKHPKACIRRAEQAGGQVEGGDLRPVTGCQSQMV